MYEEAIAIYNRAADLASSKKPNFSVFKKVLTEKEALIFVKIAQCYKQLQSTKREIEYCSKVIERAPYITDSAVLAQAYLGRGYGYEIIERFAEAKEDMTRVKELQPSN
jgi:tetratricopeptide (TPR) repeat protein